MVKRVLRRPKKANVLREGFARWTSRSTKNTGCQYRSDNNSLVFRIPAEKKPESFPRVGEELEYSWTMGGEVYERI